jgi:hypothetical protein
MITNPIPHALDVLAVAVTVGGALTWVWVGDPRWAATGLGVAVVLVSASAVIAGRTARRPAADGDQLGDEPDDNAPAGGAP